MFEKLSNAMRGNQNARKKPLLVGSLTAMTGAAVGSLVAAAQRVADNKAAFADIKIARKYKGPVAKRLVSASVNTLKKAAVSGAKAGLKRTGPASLGTGIGIALGGSAAEALRKRS